MLAFLTRLTFDSNRGSEIKSALAMRVQNLSKILLLPTPIQIVPYPVAKIQYGENVGCPLPDLTDGRPLNCCADK